MERFYKFHQLTLEIISAILIVTLLFVLPTYIVEALKESETPQTTEVTEAAQETAMEEAALRRADYTDLFSETDVEVIAKSLYQEAGHLPLVEQSMVVWCMLNSWDSEMHERTLVKIIEERFAYNPYSELEPDKVWIARDVLTRYVRERNGETEVGRTLPRGYIYMAGDQWQTHNVFRTDFYGNGDYFGVEDVTNSPY